uniref:Sushi domain-containing protein n=1 Tax=Suricata suricatta TaxID=37032 RepID=A0A673TQ33_SURSU
MGPARRSVPRALRLLGGLTVPLLLLLLLCPPAAQGDCGLPPEVPNALPTLKDSDVKSFPQGSTVTYKCNKGFIKVPGRPDSTVCLSSNQWSEVAEFCNRSCDVPPRLRFASLKKSFSKHNYFPEGFIVGYDCRPGYNRDHSLSENITCLPNFTWSKPDEFCKRKSCPSPGNIPNGHISITTDILYGATIYFSCNTGYRLVGATSSFCALGDQGVVWSDPLPECKENSQTTKDKPGVQKSPMVNVPATQSTAVAPRTTTPFHATSPQKERGTASVTERYKNEGAMII